MTRTRNTNQTRTNTQTRNETHLGVGEQQAQLKGEAAMWKNGFEEVEA